MPDLVGAGATVCAADARYDMPSQAEAPLAFLDALGVGRFVLMAHDTGATIARLLAARSPERVAALVLANTEVPGHRPPWIPPRRVAAALPGAAAAFRFALRFRAVRHSRITWGHVFHDPSHFDDDFMRRFVQPLAKDPQLLRGQLRYLRGVDWGVVDGLADVQARITAPTLFLWGREDRIFPVAEGRTLPASFRAPVTFEEDPASAFLPREEQPALFAARALAFLRAHTAGGPEGSAPRPAG
jgi:haloalkane dehalogenase